MGQHIPKPATSDFVNHHFVLFSSLQPFHYPKTFQVIYDIYKKKEYIF